MPPTGARCRPGRDQGGGVFGGAAAQGDAGGQAARVHTAGERTNPKVPLRDYDSMTNANEQSAITSFQ